jgi:hypothetical protein
VRVDVDTKLNKVSFFVFHCPITTDVHALWLYA